MSFVLYHGGFNAGLTALILIPVLDFYGIKPRLEETYKELAHHPWLRLLHRFTKK